MTEIEKPIGEAPLRELFKRGRRVARHFGERAPRLSRWLTQVIDKEICRRTLANNGIYESEELLAISFADWSDVELSEALSALDVESDALVGVGGTIAGIVRDLRRIVSCACAQRLARRDHEG